MYVSSSITPLKGERLAGIRAKPQWGDVNWNKVEKNMLTGCKPELQKQLRNRNGIWSKDYSIC